MRSGKMKTFSLFSLLLVKITVSGFAKGDSPPGPVYVSPDSTYEKPEPIASKVASPDSQITQTVYGFLDFTTTIGNTVMVFMPQSASVSPGTTEEPTTTEGATTAIEEKPVTREQLSETELFGISPSKPVNQPSDLQNEEAVVETSNEPETTTKEITTAEPETTTTKEAPTTKNSEKKTEQEKKSSTGSPMTAKKTAVKTTTPTPSKPKIAVDENPKESVTSSKVVLLAGSKVVENIVTKVEVVEGPEPSRVVETPAIYSKVEVISGEPVEEVAVNHLQPTPEYDYLSRQPSEVVDETFKVIDLKPSASRHVIIGQKSRGPDGKLRAFNSVASFHADEEPATNKSLKKVAVKVSPSAAGVRILKTAAPKPAARTPNVEPTPANPGLEDESLESLVGSQPGTVLVRQSRRPAVGGGSNFGKNKHAATPKSKSKETDDYSTTDEEQYEFASTQSEPTTPSYRKGSKFSSKGPTTTQRVPGFKQNRFNRPTTSDPESETEPTHRRFQPSSKRYDNNGGNNNNYNAAVVTPANRRTFKKHYQQQEQTPAGQSSSPQPVPTAPLAFKSKLIRPTGRWEYKTSPKPRVTIRRIDDNRHGQENATTPLTPHFPDVQVDSGDQALAGSGLSPALQHDDGDNDVLVQDVTPTASAETIRVEISTPAEFKDVYYEIATIKSPYSFQVGSVKNTRFITVTSTIQKSLVDQTESPVPAKAEPLSENILASHAPSNLYGREHSIDSSTMATLPPISLSPDQATPPLETMTESFSTTELMLKTHVLPVVRGSETSGVTLIQSYRVTRLVTAVKTLPPMDAYQFVPSKTLNEFNTRLDEAGSELHLELEYGGDNNSDGGDESHPNAAKAFLNSLDLANVGTDFDVSQMDKISGGGQPRSKKAHRMTAANHSSVQQQPPTVMSPEQLQQQLAIYRLLNPNVPLPAPVVTASRPVLRLETLFETHALPVVNAGSTYYTTLSRPVGTVTRTDYELVATTLAVPQPQLVQTPPFSPFQQQQPQLQQQPPQLLQTPQLFPAPQPSYAVTSTPVVAQSMVTLTDSRVLKLTFGAKTAYTTIYSSSVVPTQVTSYVTQSVAVQPTVAPFPNFIPYGGYPFLG